MKLVEALTTATGQQQVTMAGNGSRNGSATGATSDFHGFATGTRCCSVAVGGFFEDGTSVPTAHNYPLEVLMTLSPSSEKYCGVVAVPKGIVAMPLVVSIRDVPCGNGS